MLDGSGALLPPLLLDDDDDEEEEEEEEEEGGEGVDEDALEEGFGRLLELLVRSVGLILADTLDVRSTAICRFAALPETLLLLLLLLVMVVVVDPVVALATTLSELLFGGERGLFLDALTGLGLAGRSLSSVGCPPHVRLAAISSKISLSNCPPLPMGTMSWFMLLLLLLLLLLSSPSSSSDGEAALSDSEEPEAEKPDTDGTMPPLPSTTSMGNGVGVEGRSGEAVRS